MLTGCQISFKTLILKLHKPVFDQYIIGSLLCLLKVLTKQASSLCYDFVLGLVDFHFM